MAFASLSTCALFPSPPVTWPRPPECAPKIPPLPSLHHHCLHPGPGDHVPGPRCPPDPRTLLHVPQSHQSELALEKVEFDRAIPLSRISWLLLTAYTRQSKLAYGLLECTCPSSHERPAAGDRVTLSLPVSAALRSSASWWWTFCYCTIHFWAESDFMCEAGKGAGS